MAALIASFEKPFGAMVGGWMFIMSSTTFSLLWMKSYSKYSVTAFRFPTTNDKRQACSNEWAKNRMIEMDSSRLQHDESTTYLSSHE